MPAAAWVMVTAALLLAAALAVYLVTVAVLLRRVIGSLEVAKTASDDIVRGTEPIDPVLGSIRDDAASIQRLLEGASTGH